MKKTVGSDFPQYIEGASLEQWLRDELLVLELDNPSDIGERIKHYPIRLDASLLLVTLAGEITIVADYHTHTLKKDTVIQLLADDIIDNITYNVLNASGSILSTKRILTVLL